MEAYSGVGARALAAGDREPLISKTTPIRVLAFMEAYVVNGAAKSLLNFCDTLRAASDERVQVAIATFCRGNVKPDDTPNEFVAAVRQRGIPAFVIAERRAFDLGVIASMKRVAREFDPDIIETNNVKSHFLVRLSGLARSRKWIAVHHGYTATDSKVKLFNMLDRFALPAADRVVLVCNAFRSQLANNRVHVNRFAVVHNSAAVVRELPETSTVKQRYEIGNQSKVLVTIGRLSFEKGHADLIDALKVVRDSRPDLDWTLMIVGSGTESGNLDSQVKKHGLTDRIIFTGQQSDVLPYLAAADAMLLPSHTEGSPHVVLEAMAAAVPIIATRVGGVPEILNDEIAQLVPPGEPDALAGAIIDCLSDRQSAQLRAAEAKRVLERDFSHDAYRKNMVGLFESVLTAKQ